MYTYDPIWLEYPENISLQSILFQNVIHSFLNITLYS
jgi:hypothetical protein